MDLGPGTLIGGRYRLERLLGKGGMGEVWAANHQVTRRDVALKFLDVDHGTVPQMRRRFLREARAAAAVAHPNVIQIHDVFELEDETPVMVMDLLSGEALSDKLARHGALTVEETAHLIGSVVSAVGTAHELGIVHRDLKPENIFLARSGEGEIVVKVLDFGIAKLAHAVELDQTGAVTGTGAVLGTPYYMALEQAYGEKDIDHRADIWSLGVVLYECLAGRRPIAGDNFGQIVKFLNHGTIPPLAEVAPHVPADLAELVGRMLQRAREDRPQDLREVLAVLRRYTTSIARTFGAPQPSQTSGVHEALDATAPTARARDRVSSYVRADVPTVEVVSATPPDSKPTSARVSTGKKASPVDVTLAESGSVLAAPASGAPREGARRPALIAGAGVVAGIALTAAVVLAFSRGPRTVEPAGAPSAPPVASSVAPPLPSVEAAKPTPPTASATAEPAPASEPAPSVSAREPRAQRTVPGAPVKPIALATSAPEPRASAAASAAPVAPVTPQQPKPKGGLVDEPPF